MDFSPSQILIIQKMVDIKVLKERIHYTNSFSSNSERVFKIEILSENYDCLFPDITLEKFAAVISTMYYFRRIAFYKTLINNKYFYIFQFTNQQ